jgi:uncharacterized phage protein gp47/JayE
MSETPQTINDKYKQIVADIEGTTGQSTPASMKAFNKAIAMALAGASKILERLFYSQLKKTFPSTTFGDGLTGWGEITNLTQDGANPAILTVSILGGTPSAVISGGIQGPVWVGTNGFTYYSPIDITLDGSGNATINVESFEGGEASNLGAGSILTLTASSSVLPSSATVTAIASSGLDGESNETYRANMLQKVQRPPMGGGVADYDHWARERPNIKKGYTYSGDVPGRVELFITASDQTDDVPSAAQIQDVYDYILGDIDGIQRIPIWADELLPDTTPRFEVFASEPTDFITTITDLSPDTPSNREAIEASLDAYYTAIEPFIKGLSVINNGTITLNAIISVVQQEIELLGLDSFTSVSFATALVPGTPLTEYPVGKGERAKSTYVWV